MFRVRCKVVVGKKEIVGGGFPHRKSVDIGGDEEKGAERECQVLPGPTNQNSQTHHHGNHCHAEVTRWDQGRQEGGRV